MDKFATLEPTKLYSSAASTGARFLSRATGQKPAEIHLPLVGRLPSDLHLLVLSYLPIPDFPAYARCSRATSKLVRDDKIWEARWRALGLEKDPSLKKAIVILERKSRDQVAAAPPIIPVDDEFGDFATADAFSTSAPEEMGDFVGAFGVVPTALNETNKTKYVHVHSLLKPLLPILLSPPHLVLLELSEKVTTSLSEAAKTLRLLSRFLSPVVQPVRQWASLFLSLRTAMDRFDSSLLTAFDVADGKGDEAGMQEAAESSWEVWDPSGGDWEMGKVWAEKREIFYQQGRWQALDNFT